MEWVKEFVGMSGFLQLISRGLTTVRGVEKTEKLLSGGGPFVLYLRVMM